MTDEPETAAFPPTIYAVTASYDYNETATVLVTDAFCEAWQVYTLAFSDDCSVSGICITAWELGCPVRRCSTNPKRDNSVWVQLKEANHAL